MAERLQIIIDAKDQFSQAFTKLRGSLNRTAKSALKLSAVFGAIGVGGGIASLAAVLKDSIKVGAEFEQKIKTVGGVMRASQQEFEDLTAIARKMGETTEYTATQAAEALKFLGMTGFRASDAIKVLPGVLDLATASNTDLARTADITSNALKAMQLPVEDLNRVNDVFINTLTSANVNMENLAEAFKYGAPIAQSMGYDIETLSALIGALGDAGVQGSLAGTQLSQSFLKLDKVWKELGINGEGKNLIDALKAINAAGWDTNKVMETFDIRSGRAILVLRNMIPRIEELTAANKDSAGAAKRLADIMRDTVIGRFKELKSAIESIQLDVFKSNEGEIKRLLEDLTKVFRENRDQIIAFGDAGVKWLRAVAHELVAVAKALAWVDKNITDKIIDFFFGPTKDPTKLDLLNQQLTQAQQNIHDYYLAMAEGQPVDENFLKLQRDKIALLQQEIEALSDRAKAIKIEGLSPDEFAFPEPTKLPTLAVPNYDDEAIKELDKRLKDYISSQKAEQENFYDFLTGMDEEYNAAQVEKEREKYEQLKALRTEYLGTEYDKLQEWYDQQIEQYGTFQEGKAVIDEIYAQRKADLDEAKQQKEQQLQDETFNNLIASTKAFGKKGFAIAKAFEVAQATMAAYRSFTNTLATASEYFLPPIPQIMAGVALAAGLARVAAISATKYSGAAHGGLENVPREQTYLLDRGERVLSPAQNKDLTDFLSNGGSGLTINGDLVLEVNAPSPIQDMKKSDWQDTVEVSIIPALRTLATRGIRP